MIATTHREAQKALDVSTSLADSQNRDESLEVL